MKHRLSDVEFLVETHTHIVTEVSRRRKLQRLDRDELISAGMLGLWEAAERYDKSKGHVAFSGYAAVCIYNKMVDVARKEWGRPERGQPIKPLVHSLDNTMITDSGEMTYVDMIEANPFDVESNLWMIDKIKSFPNIRDRTILFFRYYLDWTVTEIGDWCGVSHVMVIKILKRCHRAFEPDLVGKL